MKNLSGNGQDTPSGTVPGINRLLKAALTIICVLSMSTAIGQPVKVLFSNWGLPAGIEVQSADSLSVPGWGVVYLTSAQTSIVKLVNHTRTEVRLAVRDAVPIEKSGALSFPDLPTNTTDIAAKSWAAARPRVALAFPAKTLDTQPPSGFMVVLKQHHRLGNEEAKKRALINKDSLIVDAATFRVPLHHLPISVGVSHYSATYDLYKPQSHFLWYSADSLSRKVTQALAAGVPKTMAPMVLYDLAPALNKADVSRVLRAANALPSSVTKRK